MTTHPDSKPQSALPTPDMGKSGGDEKVHVVDGVEYRFSSAWIHRLENEHEWLLQWAQQKIMDARIQPAETLLEIGPGRGFTADRLKRKGVHVTTIDIDAEKKPDIVANVVTYAFPNPYDHVAAFEVLEHLPYDQVMEMVTKIGKSCKKSMFVSVPRAERRILDVEYSLPVVGSGRKTLAVRRRKITEPHHFWELDHGKITTKRFIYDIEGRGFRLVHTLKRRSRIFFEFRRRDL